MTSSFFFFEVRSTIKFINIFYDWIGIKIRIVIKIKIIKNYNGNSGKNVNKGFRLDSFNRGRNYPLKSDNNDY